VPPDDDDDEWISEAAMDAESGDDDKDGLTVNDEVNGDRMYQADENNLGVDCKDEW